LALQNSAGSCQRKANLLYCDHIETDGEPLFRLTCENDLEGIVAKRKGDPYLEEHAHWLKIRNHSYSQWVGREELFERERKEEPTFQHTCALACDGVELEYV
jgi:ATP-dependent DNA ligase